MTFSLDVFKSWPRKNGPPEVHVQISVNESFYDAYGHTTIGLPCNSPEELAAEIARLVAELTAFKFPKVGE